MTSPTRTSKRRATWDVMPQLSLTLGVRSSQVRYTSVDHYIVGANPDDSGSRNFYNTSPVAGAVWHVDDTLNAYVSYGQGFETPTFAEIAYRPTGTGLNLALDPATSTAWEVGMKWFPDGRSASQPRGIHRDDQPGNRHRHFDGRTHHLSQRKQDAPPRVRGRLGCELGPWRGRACQLHLPAGRVCRALRFGPSARRDARRRALAGRPAAGGLWRCGVDSGRLRGLSAPPARYSTSGRVYANEVNSAFAPAYTPRQRPGLLRPGCGAIQALGICACEQHRERQLRRLRYRGGYQRALLRTLTRTQLVRGSKHQCRILSVTRRRPSRCIG